MSKYGEFEVVRGERRVCKRPKDPHADEDGMREYSYLKCPHCNAEDIEIPSNNVDRQKWSAIKDHITMCPSFTGERPSKRGKSTATDELTTLRTQMEEMKQAMESQMESQRLAMMLQLDSQKQAMEGQQQEIKELQSKTCLYDSVLKAVMPSLPLPLTAPLEMAKITLRAAAIKDITTQPIAQPTTIDCVSKEMHLAVIEQKDALIAAEKAHKEEFVSTYKKQLQEKDAELSKANSELIRAEQEKNEAERRARAANESAAAASSRAIRLQRERDTLKLKYETSLKIGQEPGNKIMEAIEAQMRTAAMMAQTAEAVEYEREFARKRARQ